jgi:hypothetical protein
MAFFFYLDGYFQEDKKDHIATWKEIEADLISRFGKPDDPRYDLKRWSTSLSAYVAGVPRGVYFHYETDALAFKLAFGKARQREGGFGK